MPTPPDVRRTFPNHHGRRTAVAAHLGVQTERLLAVERWVTRAGDELGMSLRERAILDVFLDDMKRQERADSARLDALAVHFRQAELRELEPWRVSLQRFRQRSERWAAEDVALRQQAFVDAAKSNALTAVEVLLGTYALFGGDDAVAFLGSLMVREQPEERIRSHNLYVGQACGEAFLAQYGRQLERLEWPLFPPDERFSALNAALLRGVPLDPVSGGGRKPTLLPKLFRRGDLLGLEGGASDKDPRGGGVLPVQVSEHGAAFVDVKPIEDAFNGLFESFKALRAELENVKTAPQFGTISQALADVRGRATAARDITRKQIKARPVHDAAGRARKGRPGWERGPPRGAGPEEDF